MRSSRNISCNSLTETAVLQKSQNTPVRCVAVRCNNTSDPKKGIHMDKSSFLVPAFMSHGVTYEVVNFVMSECAKEIQ